MINAIYEEGSIGKMFKNPPGKSVTQIKCFVIKTEPFTDILNAKCKSNSKYSD